MKAIIKNLPFVGPQMIRLYQLFWGKDPVIRSSKEYWINRYLRGGNSGPGSYNKLAEFKATILNDFVKVNNIDSVIEFGCGDGNQLKLANYPRYIGYDVSADAISRCRILFKDDISKKFFLISDMQRELAQLSISLDVIYHLLEDDVFNDYMCNLFDSSKLYVIIYSSNTDYLHIVTSTHIKHRKFSDWVEQMRPNWRLMHHIPNKYPYMGNDNDGSFADFFIYKKS